MIRVGWGRRDMKQASLWDDQRLTRAGAVELSLASLRAYGQRYRHWAIAYSGGKDSSATVTFVVWAIKTGQLEPPETLTILYADTRQELPPLQQAAMTLLDDLARDGFNTRVVLPALDDRFYTYILGRGVPPPTNTFRWCTPRIKVEPMMAALAGLRAQAGEKILMLTGVRLGESEVRDQRIALSCSKDSGECGQGWFQTATDEAVADTLAPLLHWRLCHVWDWLFDDQVHGYRAAQDIAVVYGDGDIRTGCVGCNLVSRDTALMRLVYEEEGFEHLKPLLELKPLFRELRQPQNRKRQPGTQRNKDGSIPKHPQRMGPLTMEARAYGLARVLDIQARAGVDLISPVEARRIRKLWLRNTWPNGWIGDEPDATEPLGRILHTDAARAKDRLMVTQALMI